MSTPHHHNPLRTWPEPEGGITHCPLYGDPESMPVAGDLYLWFPREYSLGKVKDYLDVAGIEYQAGGDRRSLVAQFPPGAFARLGGGLSEVLRPEELAATRALLLPQGAQPEQRDFGQVTSLGRLLALSSAGWLVEMLGQMRLTAHFQSIVQANAAGRRFAREGLLRGLDRNGALYAPGHMFRVAGEADLLFQLDLAARRTVIGELARHGVTGERTFLNVSPAAIFDPVYCLRSTVDAVDEAGIPRERIVFEVPEPGRGDSLEQIHGILDFVRGEGFGVAVDRAGSGSSSPELMRELRPDFIKLDMSLIRDVQSDDYRAAIAGRLLETARELGIGSVAVGVETLAELAWLRVSGADYVQGYLIDRPEPLSEQSQR